MIAQLSSTPAGARPLDQQARLKEAAKQFEAVFLRQLMSSMRAGSLGEDILGSDASNQFRDMSDARTADAMAEKGALGIAELLLKQFSPMVVPGEEYPGAGRGPDATAGLDPGLRRGTDVVSGTNR